MRVVACGPAGPDPRSPDQLVIEAGGHYALDKLDGGLESLDPRAFHKMVQDDKVAVLDEPLDYVDGKWPVFDVDGPKWIPRAEVHRWRMARSEELLKGLPADPERRLEALAAASALRSIDLQSLVKGIEGRRMAGESLADAFLRLRGRG